MWQTSLQMTANSYRGDNGSVARVHKEESSHRRCVSETLFKGEDLKSFRGYQFAEVSSSPLQLQSPEPITLS